MADSPVNLSMALGDVPGAMKKLQTAPTAKFAQPLPSPPLA